MHLKPTVFLALSVLAATSTQAQPRFPFAMPWDDATRTVTDLSDLNPAPLGEKHRISVKNGHFFDQTGRRVRFLGTNITAGAAFSKPEDAPKIAARLHKYGFNIIRLHHIDSNWPDPNIFGSGEARNSARTEVSPQSLERLDNLVAELKKHGLYINLNLHVGRALTAADGFESPEKLPEMGKVLAYFEPRFIEIQKNYARQLLNHVNPKTGLKWAKDPALACIELNNEDTLVGEAWSGKLQALPDPYRETLRAGWNDFLKTRYASTGAIKTAWNTQASADASNLLINARLSDEQGWVLERNEGATAQLSFNDLPAPANGETGPQGRVARIEITQKPAEIWHLQFQQRGLDLQPGAYYTLSFWARSDAPRALPLGFSIDQNPWSSVGGTKTLALTPQWQQVRQIFRVGADAVANHSRFSLSLGGNTSAVEVADFQLTRGASADLPDAQRLENGSLDLPSSDGVAPAQGRDWLDFLSATEKSYVAAMRQVIKTEIGYPGPVTCSQASYGGFAGVAREDIGEWTDMHAYWQHPIFPNRPWDAADWTIANTPMLDETGGGTLADLAPYRVAGKPFTVSEYNHPAPHEYASETVPLILGYAAAQDWDGVYLFDYNGNGDNWNPGQIRGFFSLDSDPNKMAMLPTMARAYLTGQIAPFAAKTTLKVARGQISTLLDTTLGDSSWNAFGRNVPDEWRRLGLTRRDLLHSRLELQLADGSGGATLLRSGPRRSLALSPSFGWNFTGKDGQLVIDTPTTKALVGRIGDAWSEGFWPLGALQIEKPASSNGWVALTVAARDGLPLEKSKSMLISALNRAENQGFTWNAARNSIGSNWGTGPIQIETPSAHLRLQTAARTATVWKLDARGARTGQILSQLKNGELSFQISPSHATPWYEIAAQMPAAKPLAKRKG